MEDRIQAQGVTFDDVLLIPQRSDILPDAVTLESRFSRAIRIRLPLVSAAMDTVTGSKLAIALASLGGIGVLHRNLSIEDQAREVAGVKRFEAGVIAHPICLAPTESVATARSVMLEKKISGIPVTEEGRLVGIITRRDLLTTGQESQPIRDVMTRKLITAGPETTASDARKILHRNKIEKLLIVDGAQKLLGLMTLKDINSQEINPASTKDPSGRLRVAAAVGVKDMPRAEALFAAEADALVVDCAHGHSKNVIETIRELRTKFKEDVQIVAGNVATREGARDLIDAGVDGLKVGIGPGSICTTRIIAGVGVPQLTAIGDCVQESSQAAVPVIADGGIRHSGDLTKAIAVGASACMVGNLLAGCTESPGETILYKGRSYKTYRGMGSLGALGGNNDRYAVTQGTGKLVPEGVEGMVPSKGPLSGIVYQLMGGLRSGMGYCGAASLVDLQKKARFVRISGAALRESHPHDVFITKEAPNYSVESEGGNP